MHDFEVVVILMAVAVALAIVAGWLRIPYPILLVVGGLLLSLQTGAPRFSLPPDVVFLAFLPPLLYAAAFNTYWQAFRKNIRSISLLAVGLVIFTTTCVAVVANQFLGMDWGPAFVLGAVVSPPDAVAAIAITSRIRLPKIVSTLLEGESLVNDASALVAYRMAVAAVLYGVFSISEASVMFVASSVGGILIGLAGAMLAVQLHRWLDHTKLADTKITIAITLLTPYAVYLPAEHLHVSGVMAVVSAGLWVGSRCKRVFRHELYIEARAVWEMMEFLLNGLIFILIGFQLPAILEGLDSKHSMIELGVQALLISVVVIVTRILWVFPGAYIPRWLDRQFTNCQDPYPPWQTVSVVAWTGMRGVVSLAAAMAIPATISNGDKFPDRELIQFLTFWVIFATLVGQGLTLPLVIRLLGINKHMENEADLHAEQSVC